MPRRREPVSIITVFNDAEVRKACLDRSIEAHCDDALDVDYVPVDNTTDCFPCAGAALNHGAREARHEFLVFVHSDVYLHSLTALEEAAGTLADYESIALLGSSGVTAQGRVFGRMRDRVVLSGESARRPMPVDTVDESLFMIPRRLLERLPLSEEEEFAWHAYAVDFGLRARADGLHVCALDMPITHNSLNVKTDNLHNERFKVDRLKVAYDALAARYPQAMPVVTPQGRVGGPPRLIDRVSAVPGLRAHRWRYRWLRESLSAYAASQAVGGSPCLLGDIRIDVDDLLEGLPSETPLLVINVDHQSTFAARPADSLALTRAGRPIELTSRPLDEVARTILGSGSVGPVLVTNLHLADLRSMAAQLSSDRRVVGFRDSIGYWMVLGAPRAAMPAAWRSRRATPLGMPELAW